MSKLPTPAGKIKTGSNLASYGANLKRPRDDSSVGDGAANFKRPKEGSLQRSKTAISQSTMNLATSVGANPKRTQAAGAAGRVAGQVRPNVGNRSAMIDRTNMARSNSTLSVQPKPTKRPAWDVKGRLDDMQQKHAETMRRLEALENMNTALQTNVEEKENVVSSTSQELEGARAEVHKLRQDLEVKEDEVRKNKRQIEELLFDKSTLERRLQETTDGLTTKQAELTALRTTVAEMSSAAAGTEARLKISEMELDSARKKISDLEKLCSEQKNSIDDYLIKQRAFETERRHLHNTIQELKGNIRVFCRVRPLLASETDKQPDELRHIMCGERSIDVAKVTETPNGSSKAERHRFEFDQVFAQGTTQAQVFEEVSQLAQSAIDGYNVCIFAYGQTGSGKTFTMEGGDNLSDEGIIPRTIKMIFEATKNLREKGWEYSMHASFLEIYNEDIRDLLATEKGIKYEIKKVDSKSNEIYVTNLKIEEVVSEDVVSALLSRAKKNRSVAATNCNERSSRSHSVFILKIVGKNSITSEACTGTLNLVDLAGSERLKESGSTGLRLEETKSINTSLSNLSKVIMALANKDHYVPFRDSKLTYLLMNSLGGNSKTLMFVNVSPREDYLNETLNSLRFAKRVNQCQIGTATKKINAESK